MSFFGTVGNTQPEMRHSATAKDQHGRKWMVVIEKKPMSPCYVTPMFTAKIIPPTHLLSFPGDLPTQIVIDYDRWEQEVAQAENDYLDRRAELEQIAHGERADVDLTKPVTRQIARVLGKAPAVTAEQVRKMRDGDPELLGLKPRGDTGKAKKGSRTAALAEL